MTDFSINQLSAPSAEKLAFHRFVEKFVQFDRTVTGGLIELDLGVNGLYYGFDIRKSLVGSDDRVDSGITVSYERTPSGPTFKRMSCTSSGAWSVIAVIAWLIVFFSGFGVAKNARARSSDRAFSSASASGGLAPCRDPDGSNPRQITFTEKDGAILPVFSPDGKRIIYTETVGNSRNPFILDLMIPWTHQNAATAAAARYKSICYRHRLSKDQKKLLVDYFERGGEESGIAVFDFETSKYEKVTAMGALPFWLNDNGILSSPVKTRFTSAIRRQKNYRALQAFGLRTAARQHLTR